MERRTKGGNDLLVNVIDDVVGATCDEKKELCKPVHRLALLRELHRKTWPKYHGLSE